MIADKFYNKSNNQQQVLVIAQNIIDTNKDQLFTGLASSNITILIFKKKMDQITTFFEDSFHLQVSNMQIATVEDMVTKGIYEK